MLKPAMMYEEVVKQKLRDTWYDETYMYYHSDNYRGDFDLKDDSRWYFVSVDTSNEVLGFISFQIDRDVNQARNWGAISFDIGNVTFIRDLFNLIDDIFNKYHFNRLEWCCVGGNPILPTYIRYCIKHGGEQVAHEHECARTLDGTIRDVFTFEILANKYVPLSKSRR